jgi:uncharacterized protein
MRETNSEMAKRGAFRRYISRVKMVKLLVFALSLLGALVLFQLLLGLVARQIHPSARWLWFSLAEIAYGCGMLWLYSREVRYFEYREVTELRPRAALLQSPAGIAFGSVLFGAVFALLALGGFVQRIAFGGLAGIAVQVSTCFGAAIGEELVFRGAIFRIAEEWLGTTAALVISALLFGLAHAINSEATATSIAAIALESGVLLGAAYAASRSLWFPIGIHFGWNFTEGGIFGTAVSGGGSHGLFLSVLDGPAVFTGGAFGPEASIVAVAVCLVATSALCVYSARRGHWKPRNR